MYAHFCHNNDFFTEQILRIITADIEGSLTTFGEIIKYTPLLRNIARVEISKDNAIFLVESLFETSFVTAQKEYIKIADSLLNATLEVISRNADACRYMRDLPDSLKVIEKFHEKNIVPASRGGKALFKDIQRDKLDKHLSNVEQEIIEGYSTQRLDLYTQLLVEIDYEELINQTLHDDRKEELSTWNILEKGEMVDYYKEDYKFWVEATVQEDYGAVLLVDYTNPSVVVNNPLRERIDEHRKSVKINKDTCKPSGLHTNNPMDKVNSIYQYLHMKVSSKSRYY